MFQGAHYRGTEPHQPILEKVVRGALPHAVHHGLFAHYTCEHDHGYIETALLQHFERAKGIELRPQIIVREDDIRHALQLKAELRFGFRAEAMNREPAPPQFPHAYYKVPSLPFPYHYHSE